MATTVSISVTRTTAGGSGVGLLTITSGDTTNAKSWSVICVPTCENDITGAKEAIWNEIVRQVAAI